MIEPVTVVIPGQPVPKARPRFTGRGGVYTPAKTSSYELLIRLLANREMAGKQKLEGPLEIKMRAHFKIPKSWSAAKKARALAGEIVPGRADADNILKSVQDSLQKIVFDNDRQIVRAHAEKAFTPGEPFVVATVKSVSVNRVPEATETAERA